jgi:hypothetical protein
VRERIEDWGKGLCAKLGKKMVELTGGCGCVRGGVTVFHQQNSHISEIMVETVSPAWQVTAPGRHLAAIVSQ